jgi:Protein of unknown function (DUF2917)
MHPIHHALFGATATHAASAPKDLATQPVRRGAFALQAGHAITLRPKAQAMLRITQGAAWVTLPSQPGDHFLRAGDSLRISACDRVVMEAWQVPATQSLYFDWDPLPMQITAADTVAARGNRLSAPKWSAPRPSYCAAVRQPLADLRAALALAVGATGRLATGFAAWGFGSALALVLGTGLAARARSAHSSASAAQGRMASGESIASSGAL